MLLLAFERSAIRLPVQSTAKPYHTMDTNDPITMIAVRVLPLTNLDRVRGAVACICKFVKSTENVLQASCQPAHQALSKGAYNMHLIVSELFNQATYSLPDGPHLANCWSKAETARNPLHSSIGFTAGRSGSTSLNIRRSPS